MQVWPGLVQWLLLFLQVTEKQKSTSKTVLNPCVIAFPVLVGFSLSSAMELPNLNSSCLRHGLQVHPQFK